MKKLLLSVFIAIFLFSGCAAFERPDSTPIPVTTLNPPPLSTLSPVVPLPSSVPVTQELLIGRWKYNTAINSKTGSVASKILYGSGYKYGGYLRFFNDGTFTKYIGVISDEYEHFSGSYSITNDIVTLHFYNGNQQTVIYDGEQIILQRKEYDYNEEVFLYYEYFKKVSSEPFSGQDDKE